LDWKAADPALGGTIENMASKTAAAEELVMILTFQITFKAFHVPNDTSILWNMQR
jgi:hypothetical protein